MRVLTQGKPLTPGDLGLLPRDPEGRMIDPSAISYSIFKRDATGIRTLATAPKMVPAREGAGVYYVKMTIPTNWEGQYDLVWYLKQYPSSAEDQVFEEFEVVKVDPLTSSMEAPSMLLTSRPGINKRIAGMVVTARELLADTDPDRNYHFRPPTPGKVVAGYTNRVGYIWTDATIIRLGRLVIEQLNTWNPLGMTYWTLESAPEAWKQCTALGIAAKCLSNEAARWGADEFQYSLNGVSLDLQKSSTYQALAGEYLAEFQEWAPLLTANRPCSMGVRQQRWLLGAIALCAVLPHIASAVL